MDDITKTIIAVLAGFATAFLAEPVKIWFQKRAKLMDMRIALYKEMYNNYLSCRNVNEFLRQDIEKTGDVDDVNDEKIQRTIYVRLLLLKAKLRNEYFQQQVLKNELSLFYQLPEAIAILNFENSLSFILERADYLIDRFGKEEISGSHVLFLCGNYASNFLLRSLDNSLNKKVLKKAIGKSEFNELISTSITIIDGEKGILKFQIIDRKNSGQHIDIVPDERPVAL